jgi:hypothetical protein
MDLLTTNALGHICVGRTFGQKYKLWVLCDAEGTSELVMVCRGVRYGGAG